MLESATGVDVHGAITGYGPYREGPMRAFLLTPPLDLRLDLRNHDNLLDTNFPNPHETGQSNMTMGVTLRNVGAFDGSVAYYATGVVVTDTLTGPIEILSWGTSNCSQDGLQLTCNLTPFEFSRDLMIKVRTTAPGAITHSATISAADAPDPNPSNNSGTDPNNTRQFYVNTKAVSAPVTVQISATYGLVTKTMPLTVMPAGSHWPFTGTGLSIPGTIQAEDFDGGSEGGGYHDTTLGNDGDS